MAAQSQAKRSSYTCAEGEPFWLQCVKEWYPSRHTQTYFVPPVYMNRVPCSEETICSEHVLCLKPAKGKPGEPCPAPHAAATTRRRHASSPLPGSSACARTRRRSSTDPCPVYDSDVRDDRAQQHVLICLQKLTEKQAEPMVVLSQMRFEDYLTKKSYDATCKIMRRPRDLDVKLQRGDFDILVIHRNYGLVVFEVKAVLENMLEQNLTADKTNAIIIEKVRRAIEQLNKSEEVLSYLVADIAEGLTITKTLVLPSVTSVQLRRALKSDPLLQHEFCKCLGLSVPPAGSSDEQHLTTCISLCLCSDHLSPHSAPHHVTDDVIRGLVDWWSRRVAGSGPDSLMTTEVYDRLLARFCGPATTISVPCVTPPRMELRTPAEAVSETGERMARIALVPEQVDLLNNPRPRVLVTGPPGTGKSVTLLLKGKQWLAGVHDVQVASLWPGSYAASYLLYCQLLQILGTPASTSACRVQCFFRLLKEKLRSSSARVRFHQFNIRDDRGCGTAVSTLAECAENRCGGPALYVLVDEGVPDKESVGRLQRFCADLKRRVGGGLQLWVATMFAHDAADCWVRCDLTKSLRCPPNVVHQVEEAPQIQSGDVLKYRASEVPAPCEGPPPKRILHDTCGENGHTRTVWPYACAGCMQELVKILKELQVGAAGVTSTSDQTGSGAGCDVTSPPALQYRDVLILAGELHAISALEVSLGSAGIPFKVVKPGENRDINDLARGESDRVTVTSFHVSRGLERKVVVVVEREWECETECMRLLAMSRCTSQLIWVSRIE